MNFQAMQQFVLFFVLVISSPLTWAKWHTDDQSIMGTNVSVILWLEDDAKAEQAIAAVMAEMRRIDEHLSH